MSIKRASETQHHDMTERLRSDSTVVDGTCTVWIMFTNFARHCFARNARHFSSEHLANGKALPNLGPGLSRDCRTK